MKESSENACPVCGSKQLKVFFKLWNVPVHCNVLWPSQEAAQNCPRGDIRLAFCPICSFILNLDFEPGRLQYTQTYENPLDFSHRFQVYERSLARRLIKRYDLYRKNIIEIGCGKGHFLKLLCQLGNNSGVGFDPTYVEQEKQNEEGKDQVKFIQDFYSERYWNYQGDLIVCRQTLEHIENPQAFLNMLRRVIGNRLDAHVCFEVPNALQTFRKLFVWDIIYEHCSYFTPISLSLIFSLSGFRVCELTEEYEGQFLCIHAAPSNQGILNPDDMQRGEVNQTASDVTSFAATHQRKVEVWRRALKQVESGGQRAVVWGAGSKGVSFLNALKSSQVEYVVDINPNKQGKYVPGTGQQIVPPKFLHDYQPEVIIIMNPIYRFEIRNLTKKLGLAPKFVYA